MPVTVTGAIIDTDAALARLVEQLTPRLEAVGERIAENARKTLSAHLSKSVTKREKENKNPGSRSKGEPIVLAGSRGLTERQTLMRREILGGEPKEVVFSNAMANRGLATPTKVAREFAGLFRFKSGGGKPDIVAIQKGLLRGIRITGKPHLIDTIASEGVVREGDMLRLTVAARSDHANLVELGFHHKGDGQIAGRPFMRPALEQEREGLVSGRSLRG